MLFLLATACAVAVSSPVNNTASFNNTRGFPNDTESDPPTQQDDVTISSGEFVTAKPPEEFSGNGSGEGKTLNGSGEGKTYSTLPLLAKEPVDADNSGSGGDPAEVAGSSGQSGSGITESNETKITAGKEEDKEKDEED